MLRCLFVDVMRRPESEFWSSTVREICERWELYAEATGRKEPAPVVDMFDD